MRLDDHAFDAISAMFHRVSGIRLTPVKRSLVEGRLLKLARERGVADINDYVRELVEGHDEQELTRAVDKLTTNETYFFREPQHFKHLAEWLRTEARTAAPVRVWSAACSSGEEVYSLAMLMAEVRAQAPWELIGTDLSSAVIEQAQRGLYPLERARNVPQHYLKRWCLKGRQDFEGMLLISQDLRRRVQFRQANLTRPLPEIGQFDVIFLRNVLIYFDNPGKADIIRRVLTRLAPQGRLYTGHAESIGNLGLPVRSIAPAVYVHA